MRRVLISVGIIAIAAVSRLFPHVPNVTPIAAMALAGGVYLEKKFAFVLPVAALFLSDIVLGFHPTMPFVYGSFLMTVLIGMWLRTHKKILTLVVGSVMSSIVFFIVTNFGVWFTGGGWNYPKTLEGLLECYSLALPFFRNSLVGDLTYTAIIFGLFEVAELILQRFEQSRERTVIH
ncbi:MAG: hypothetical protein N3A63_10030 [Bacteroidetes bacterium]|nr:hypothetical protein [Bacteroidota bacterium]